MKKTPPRGTWVALLRGINVGGNNVIRMADLKRSFERLGCEDVRTLIASGNVVFRSALPRARLERRLEAALSKEYGYESRLVLRTLPELERLVAGAPKGWGMDKGRRYNVCFLRPAVDSREVLDGLEPKPELEQVTWRPGVLFWTARFADLTRTSMVKLASKPLYQQMTVRNWNTTRKVLALMQAVERSAGRAR